MTVTRYDTHLLVTRRHKNLSNFLKPDGSIWPITVVNRIVAGSFKQTRERRADSTRRTNRNSISVKKTDEKSNLTGTHFNLDSMNWSLSEVTGTET